MTQRSSPVAHSAAVLPRDRRPAVLFAPGFWAKHGVLRGQTLVIVAALIPVLMAFVALLLQVSTILWQQEAIRYAAQVAARKGSLQVDMARWANGQLALDCGTANSEARAKLFEALNYLPFALLEGTTREDVVAAAEIQVVNIVPGTCNYDPNAARPTVTVTVRVPSALFFVHITLRLTSRVEVFAPGGLP